MISIWTWDRFDFHTNCINLAAEVWGSCTGELLDEQSRLEIGLCRDLSLWAKMTCFSQLKCQLIIFLRIFAVFVLCSEYIDISAYIYILSIYIYILSIYIYYILYHYYITLINSMYNSHFFPSSRVKAASLVDESGSLLGSPALRLAACRQAPLGSRLGEFLCQFEHFSPYKTPYFWIILYHTCWRYNHTFWIILVGDFLELPKGWPFCPMTFDKNTLKL